MIQIEKEKLNTVLRSFFTITGVRIAIYDIWLNEIAAYPAARCAFCERMRKNELFDMECQKCDKEAFTLAHSKGEQYTYRCHAGLYESICPIIIDGCIAGYLMIGQFIQKSEKSTVGTKKPYMSDGTVLQHEVDSLTTLTAECVEAIAAIMLICTEYLCSSRTISLKSTGIAEKAERYIDEHLKEPLSVAALSDALGISRTSLYNVIKKNFGKSITEFINHKKIIAVRKMTDEGISTDKILEEINITDVNYFYRLFKKHTGMTIKEYRKRNNTPKT